MRPNRRQILGMMAGAPAALALQHAPALASPPVAPAPRRLRHDGPVHGINPADMDLTADPRNDFYRYANGGWLDRVTIPANRSNYGVFTELGERTSHQLIGLLRNIAGSDAVDEGSDAWKAVALFRQGNDTASRNRHGVSPIQDTLDAIAAISDLAALHAFFQTAPLRGAPSLVDLWVETNLVDSSVHALYLGGPPLGLPNRDYYLDDTESNTRAREAYIAASAQLLAHAGHDAAAAAADAEAVYELERRMAAETLSREERQDFSLSYNPVSIAELAEIYPLMDWGAYLGELGMQAPTQVIVGELGFVRALGAIVRETPLEVLKHYLTMHSVWSCSTWLSEDIEAAAFAYDAALSGTTEQRPLDERVLDDVSDAVPDAVGQLYVAAYFPPEAKDQIGYLVDELIRAFADRIARNNWMTDATRAKAREKLDALGVKVGYPDTWETYEDVVIGDSYAASMLSTVSAMRRRNFAKLGTPVDKSEWGEPAQMVNAFYDPVANDITFPAAILQPPFFDYQADPASNYGGIGYVIGHEITHGFDQGGAQFDAAGNLANWWADEDFAAFDRLNQQVVEQYSAIEVLPGVYINGQITVGENVADLGGVQVALDALERLLAERGHTLDDVLHGSVTGATPAVPSPVAAFATPVASPSATPAAADAAGRLTQRERFFIAAATVWRLKIRDEALATLVQVDTHSPAMVRATQASRNTDAFHEAFGVQRGDAMYLAPEDRIVVW